MRVGTVLLRSSILFFIIIPLASSQPNPDTSAITDIRGLLTRQASDWNHGNIDRYMEGYWKSESLLFTSGGKVRRGWRETLEKYRKSYDSKAKMGVLRFADLEIHLVSAASAWVFGRWELERKTDRPGGVFTLVLRKFSDGWKVVHDHTSSSPPADSARTSP